MTIFKTLGKNLFCSAIGGIFSFNSICQQKPNIVVFIADDLGWEESTPYGNKVVQTPNLQRIADQGMRFNNFFLTASSCSPSRSGILSGLYPHSTGAMNLHEDMKPNVQLFPELLKNEGYYTMLVGKSHGTNNPQVKKKFDIASLVDWSKPWEMGNMWLTALNNAPKDKPFFLWASSIDPHRPYNQGVCPFTHKPEDVIVPPYLPDIPEMRKELAEYYDEISRFDQHVGMVLKYLEDTKQLDNTLIFVMSDNGRPFPQCKTRLNIQGLKSPFLVRFPKIVKPGSTTSSLISAVDMAPTILEIAGAKPLEKGQGKSFVKVLKNPATTFRDYVFGEHNWHSTMAFERVVISSKYIFIKNWLPDLNASPPPDPAREPAYQKMWKMYEERQLLPKYTDCFITPRDSFELFDAKTDIHCMQNLMHNPDYSKIAKRLKTKLYEWMKETGDYFPDRENLKPDNIDRRTGLPLEKNNKPE